MSASELTNGCVVCGPGIGRNEHSVNEGMFATGETFTYHECHGCGSLQICPVPDSLEFYYDASTYYSFAGTRARLQQRWLRTAPARVALKIAARRVVSGAPIASSTSAVGTEPTWP